MDASAYSRSFDKEQLSILCANYDRRIDTLANENAELRERVAELEELTDERRYIPQEWYARLGAKNAKLRELLTFYLGCLTKGHVNCDSCAISGDGDCGHGRMVIDKARELGIEV